MQNFSLDLFEEDEFTVDKEREFLEILERHFQESSLVHLTSFPSWF